MPMYNNNGFGGLDDYSSDFPAQVTPATNVPKPRGPSNFPVQTPPPSTPTELLQGILKQVTNQNLARIPHIRSRDIDQNGQTLDWSQIGLMDKFLLRNKGPDSVWVSFDMAGPSVDSFTSDLSIEVQMNESWNIPFCQFYKIGAKCAAGGTGTLHAIAFQASAGDLGGGIS